MPTEHSDSEVDNTHDAIPMTLDREDFLKPLSCYHLQHLLRMHTGSAEYAEIILGKLDGTVHSGVMIVSRKEKCRKASRGSTKGQVFCGLLKS